MTIIMMFHAVFLFIIIMRRSLSQVTYDIPENWYVHDKYFYKFERDKPETYDNAMVVCNMFGAGVLSVDNAEENSFIVQWLKTNDLTQREWYTSGVADASAGKNMARKGFVWESTGQAVASSLMSLWLQPPELGISRGSIVYSFGQSGPGWIFTDSLIKRAYICKIAQQEMYRILGNKRGFDYGSSELNDNRLERGPHFISQPHSVLVVKETGRVSESVSLECLVFANPPATYRWFKGKVLQTEITETFNSRYIIISGKLIIERPDDVLDSDEYQCAAENKFGTVISDVVEITFGSLGEFSNVQDAGTRAKAYEGATLECSKIHFKPGVLYQWIKGTSQQFVRTEFQKYIFISNNGKLYFSEVTKHDEDQYMCVATLTGVNNYIIGTSQPPMRTSLPIPFIVDDQAPKADWGPKIQNDFIAVFPKTPLKGQDVRMECFAYGSCESSTSSFSYSWSRDGGTMSESAELQDHNRVLILRNAQLEDSGIYRCTVSRGSQAKDTKTIHLVLEAKPYFVTPLEDQHADIDSQITWICNARGIPSPVYQWYKNGQKLTTSSGNHLKVVRNVLRISHLDPDLHNGMYQCGAENSHGVSLSNAQLRVLAFPPTISKYQPPTSLFAPEHGNVTLRCNPEGAPFPVIGWLKDGSLVSSDGLKLTVLTNGNLHITSLTVSDSGAYTCKATNVYGEANATTLLDITQGATITMPPSDVTLVVNKTVFMICEASFPRDIDLIYEWTFNGFSLDFEKGHYRQMQNGQPGRNGLYIINAQFEHEGWYMCFARTPFNSESVSAYLKILGPPRQPAGVYAISDTVSQNSTAVAWTEGSSGGGTITAHLIQAENEFEPEIWRDIITVSVKDSYKMEDPIQGKHSYLASGLNPGIGYQFRVIAQNEYGFGPPSDPSTYIQLLRTAPSVHPRHLRGGGGSVGDLTIRWDPLQRSEYGSRSVSYRVYWRKKVEAVISQLFEGMTVNDPNKDFLVVQVGGDNYYLTYEVKIQAFNELGSGPNSSVVEIFSAENLPIGIPQNVKTSTFNGTAIEVFWEPVPDTRESAQGKIVGYQINYWEEESDPNVYMQSIRYYGQIDYGLVIGLLENFNWIVDIQVYNSAGLGPRSNQYIMETSGYAPLTYPQEVHISSAGPYRARLWWRGITLTVNEEALVGYAIWLWTASESFLSAEMIEVPGRACTYVLKDIQPSRLYAMRLAAVSGGGYGKKTPPMYFTTEGQVLIDYHLAEMVDAFLSFGCKCRSSIVLVLLCYFIRCVVVFHL